MRKARLKGLAGAILTGSFLLAVPGTALAASKPINSVNIKVNSKIESGSKLPDIDIGTTPSDGGVAVSESNDRYEIAEAEWVNNSGKEVYTADEPRMKVTLEPEDVSEYYFLASYKKSSVSINGGTFVSARREGDALVVTLTLKPVKGEYGEPLDAFWYEKNLGEARWEKPKDTSGFYEVQLYRDGKSVYRIPRTSAVKYNFYPYMTEAGDYTFRVRTIPGTDAVSKYGKRSDWIESGELQITDRYVSDGKGQQASKSKAVRGAEETGWKQKDKQWSYTYPDGTICRGGWEYIEGQWYYFNIDGVMQTGWQNIDNQHYYLYPNGQMAVGWANIDGKWYFFHTGEHEDETAGTMAPGGWKVIGPYYYYFNEDGSLYTGWLNQNGRWYYLNTVDNSLLGAMFTGWIKRDDKTYYTDSNGEMVTGWCQIDGNWHYFYPGSGEMAANTSINGFFVDADGIWR